MEDCQLNSCIKSVLSYNLFIHQSFYLTAFGFVNGMLSWQEQRNFTNLGLDALGNHTLVKDIVYQLNQIQAKQPDMSGQTGIMEFISIHNSIFTLTVKFYRGIFISV